MLGAGDEVGRLEEAPEPDTVSCEYSQALFRSLVISVRVGVLEVGGLLRAGLMWAALTSHLRFCCVWGSAPPPTSLAGFCFSGTLCRGGTVRVPVALSAVLGVGVAELTLKPLASPVSNLGEHTHPSPNRWHTLGTWAQVKNAV